MSVPRPFSSNGVPFSASGPSHSGPYSTGGVGAVRLPVVSGVVTFFGSTCQVPIWRSGPNRRAQVVLATASQFNLKVSPKGASRSMAPVSSS